MFFFSKGKTFRFFLVDIRYVLSIIHVANEDVNVSSGNFDVRFASSNLHITTQRSCQIGLYGVVIVVLF